MLAPTTTMLTDELFPHEVEGQLSVDVFETDDAMIVQSAIAGVAAHDLQIHVNPDVVTIRGTRERDRRIQTATVHHEECFWGAFSRTVVLPHPVRADLADAELKDGVLTITMPKECATTASIAVRTVS